MGVCILVASGLNFDVDGYLQKSPFKASGVFRKGEVPPKDNPQRKLRPDSGFTVLLSDDEEPDLSNQIEEALTFLVKHEKDLDHLKDVGVANLLLDFGLQLKDELQRSEYLPPELMVALGRFRMGLIFSTVQLPRG